MVFELRQEVTASSQGHDFFSIGFQSELPMHFDANARFFF
jgi:hypothetical protein